MGRRVQGSHEPLVDRSTSERVQELLDSRAMCGTRERRHHHYLKGLLVCAVCGRRLSVQRSKGTYTYFYCLGQRDRRTARGVGERSVEAELLGSEAEPSTTSICPTSGPRVCARPSPPRWLRGTRTQPQHARSSSAGTRRVPSGTS